jgi:hypothetical protein
MKARVSPGWGWSPPPAPCPRLPLGAASRGVPWRDVTGDASRNDSEGLPLMRGFKGTPQAAPWRVGPERRHLRIAWAELEGVAHVVEGSRIGGYLHDRAHAFSHAPR